MPCNIKERGGGNRQLMENRVPDLIVFPVNSVYHIWTEMWPLHLDLGSSHKYYNVVAGAKDF